MPSGTVSGRRRGALRELLGLQGAAPAGWLSEERPRGAVPGRAERTER